METFLEKWNEKAKKVRQITVYFGKVTPRGPAAPDTSSTSSASVIL